MKTYLLNIVGVTPTWNCAKHEYMIHVKDEDYDRDRSNFFIEYFSRMFGIAEFFNCKDGISTYLVGHKTHIRTK